MLCSKSGSFYRFSDARWIQRFRCKLCRTSFSKATFDLRYRQKKRRVNSALDELLCSGVSQRRAARILGIHPITVARKFRFLATLARAKHLEFLESFRTTPIDSVQFDDVETSEHSKCKPLSISLAVNAMSRQILAIEVSEMPAKGPLAKISRKKYGPRKDKRPEALNRPIEGLRPVASTN